MSVARLAIEQLMREEEARADAEKRLCRIEREKLLKPQQRENLARRKCAARLLRWWRERPSQKPVRNCEIAALVRSMRRAEE